MTEADRRRCEAHEKLSVGNMLCDDTPLSEDTPFFTVTNKSEMCVEVYFHIEIYNHSDEMLVVEGEELMTNVGPLEPHQLRPGTFWLTNDIKEVRISLDSIETYDFKEGGLDWDTKQWGCTRYDGKDGHPWISSGPTIRR